MLLYFLFVTTYNRIITLTRKLRDHERENKTIFYMKMKPKLLTKLSVYKDIERN